MKNNELIGKDAEKWEEVLWEQILGKMSGLNSKNDLKVILEGLLSHQEKKAILRRLAAIALVRAGKSYKEIGKILWVSPATISAIKKNLTAGFGNYRSHRSIYRKKEAIFLPVKESAADKFLNVAGALIEAITISFFMPPGLGVTDRGIHFYQSQSTRKKKR